jgi:hypothetical protein
MCFVPIYGFRFYPESIQFQGWLDDSSYNYHELAATFTSVSYNNMPGLFWGANSNVMLFFGFRTLDIRLNLNLWLEPFTVKDICVAHLTQTDHGRETMALIDQDLHSWLGNLPKELSKFSKELRNSKNWKGADLFLCPE